VLIETGTKNAYNIVDNNEKESISVLMGNATGQLAPPLIILSYKRIPSYINTKLPQGWAIGRSESGWMTGEIFFEYIANTFHNWIIKNNIPRPILLFLDGHTSHLTMPLSDFCSANGIEVIYIALKPNSTHILQPMDVALFGPLKCSWKKKVNEYRNQYEQLSVRKKDFAFLLKNTLETLNLCKILKNGFRACGLYPFNIDALDFSKILNKNKLNNTFQVTNIKYEELLLYLEKEIELDTSQEFKKQQSDTWHGKSEDTSLFKIWHKISNKVNNITINLKSTDAAQSIDCIEASTSSSQIELCSNLLQKNAAATNMDVRKETIAYNSDDLVTHIKPSSS